VFSNRTGNHQFARAPEWQYAAAVLSCARGDTSPALLNLNLLKLIPSSHDKATQNVASFRSLDCKTLIRQGRGY